MRRDLLALLVTLSVVLSIGGFAVRAATSPTDPSPATGHAQVIAHGVAKMPASEFAWRVTSQSAELPADAANGKRPLGFLLADADPIFVTDDSKHEEARLASGEALFVRSGVKQRRISLTDQPASYFQIDLVDAQLANDAGDGELIFAGLTLGTISGTHDLDLVRDVLRPDEASEIGTSGPPFLLFVTAGSVTVTSDVSDASPPVDMLAGDAKELVGSVTVTATGDDGATFVAAIIGPEIPADLLTTPTAEPVEPTEPTADEATGTVRAETRICIQDFDPAGATVEQLETNCSAPLEQPLMHLIIDGTDNPQEATDGTADWADVPASTISLTEEGPNAPGQIACSGKWDDQPDGSPASGDVFAGDPDQGGVIDYDFKAGEALICVFYHALPVQVGSGSISFQVRLCPGGMIADTLDPGECWIATDGFDFSLSSPHQTLTRDLSDATYDEQSGFFTWPDLPFRPVDFGYGVGENELPEGYTSYIIESDGPVTDLGDGGYVVNLTADDPDVTMTVYNFGPETTGGSVTIHVRTCPAGMTPDTLDADQCEPTIADEEHPSLFYGASPNDPEVSVTTIDDGYRWDNVPFTTIAFRDKALPADWSLIADGLDGDPAGAINQLPSIELTPDNPDAEVTLYYFPPAP
ncbi:MAG TPA: hypothetical protein VKB09_15240 [Thermomicrobiales bacterium]|nr:hypothetical protein [Thermomicrobiales bacterium]